MKKHWLTVFVLLFFLQLEAQNQWQIFGYIRNESGEPLPGSSIQIDGSAGVVAAADGYFQISVQQRPAELTIRCSGYFPKRVSLQAADFQNNKARMDILLTSQETALKEVSIAAKKVEILAEENFLTDIYDYEFVGGNLLLLVRERKRHFARMMSDKGEKLSEMQLDGQPTELHRSCTGSLHLVGSAFAQELTINGLRLDTFPRYSLQKFRQFIEPCVQQVRDYYFFQVGGIFKKAVTYIYFDPEKKCHLLANIRDEAGEAEAMEAYAELRYGAPVFIHTLERLRGISDEFGPLKGAVPANVFSDVALKHYANSNDQLAHWGRLQSLQMDSVYAPLLKIGDTLLLFDHVSGQLLRYNVPVSNTTALPLRYYQEKGWKKELLKDEATQVVYGHFAPGDRHCLRSIDLNNGEVTAEYPIPEVPLISQNFKVSNGFLYFLGRSSVNIPNSRLYKINISQKNTSN